MNAYREAAVGPLNDGGKFILLNEESDGSDNPFPSARVEFYDRERCLSIRDENDQQCVIIGPRQLETLLKWLGGVRP
jgi:hypothetical protein